MSAPLITYLIPRETAQEEGEREQLAISASAEGNRNISTHICIDIRKIELPRVRENDSDSEE